MKHRPGICCATLCALLATAGFAAEAPGSGPAVGSWGVDLTDQDRSVKPGDDFYRFENGAWLARIEAGVGHQNAAYWMDLRTLAPRRLNAIMEKLVADSSLPAESPEGKTAAFYRAYMNQAAVEAKGLEPLAPELNAIRAVKTRSEMAALTGAIEGPGTTRDARVVPIGRGMFSVNIDQDPRHPDRYSVLVGQAGLLLPGPEFYTDASLADFKMAYQAYASQMLGMIGWPEPERYAREIVAFETRVARVSWTHEQMLDRAKTHNSMTVASLEKLAPNFDWRAFFEGAGVKGVDHVVIDARDAFPQLASVFAETPLDVLKARQAFATVDSRAALLPERISNAAVQFRSVKLAGQSAAGQRTRNDTAQVVLQANVPDLLGRLYARFCSSEEVKAKAQEMAGYMKQALDLRLRNVSWMEPETRAIARVKLAQMKINIGYPDRFDDYSGLAIRGDDLYGDVTRASAYRWREQVADLKQPFDRGRWAMTPQYPNYNYRAETNTVEIPAALLQPPFFDPSADDAVNYGAIGAILGQVMISGVDDRGGERDASGRLNPWWKPADRARFETLRQGLIRQYSQFEPLPGLHVQGALIVGEAIDDQGGLLTALDAYHLALRGHPAPVIDGYSGDQRFFLGRAQMWRAKFGADFVRNQIATGANAPPFIRVNGAISNVDAWYNSFNVKPGDKLYLAPADRVHLW